MSLIHYLEQTVNWCMASWPRKSAGPELVSQQKIIAHRGAHSVKDGLKENTDAAFAKAQALGCWGIELDIQATADNVLVVNHDPSLTRIWGVSRLIEDLTWEQLHLLAPEVPLLSDVIVKYGKQMHLFIEPKTPFRAHDALAETLASLNACEDYHLLCLDEHLITGLASVFPRQSLVFVAGIHNTAHFCRASLQKSYGGVTGHYLLLTDKWIDVLRAAGQCQGVGFVDSRRSLYREVNRGVPWVFSNNIDALLAGNAE